MVEKMDELGFPDDCHCHPYGIHLIAGDGDVKLALL